MLFPLVDLLRGFAALSVLVYHLIGHWEWTDFPGVGPLAWFQEGWLAVAPHLFYRSGGGTIPYDDTEGMYRHLGALSDVGTLDDRGPRRDGVYRERAIRTNWPAAATPCRPASACGSTRSPGS